MPHAKHCYTGASVNLDADGRCGLSWKLISITLGFEKRKYMKPTFRLEMSCRAAGLKGHLKAAASEQKKSDAMIQI